MEDKFIPYKTIYLKHSKASIDVQKHMAKAMHELEEHGRTIFDHPKTARYLSFRFGIRRGQSKDIFFGRDDRHHSMIVLAPDIKIKTININKVRLYRENHTKKSKVQGAIIY